MNQAMTRRAISSSGIDLSRATDEELLTELRWRGYKIDLPAASNSWPSRGMVAHEFRESLERDYGIKVRFGFRRERFWQVMLDSYPNAATYDRIQAECYSSYNDPDCRSGAVHAMVCQENKMLRPTPFRIENVWGVGYRLVRKESGSGQST